jgi:hypothetical protein
METRLRERGQIREAFTQCLHIRDSFEPGAEEYRDDWWRQPPHEDRFGHRDSGFARKKDGISHGSSLQGPCRVG